MLAGEYAVLEGSPSLSLAVKKELRCTARLSDFHKTVIRSDIWSEPLILDEALSKEPNNPLLDTVRWACKEWSLPPLEITIASDIQVSDGLGSSSAVRLASLAAMAALTGRQEQPWDLARLCWDQQRQEQGFASGYDFVTQVQGGLVAFYPDYSCWPGRVEDHKLRSLIPYIHIFRGGKGAPTGLVAGSTRKWLRERRRMLSLTQRSEQLIQNFIGFSQASVKLPELIQSVKAHREIFEDNPNFPLHLLRALQELKGFDQSWTFKTTGAGGEDSILLIGDTSDLDEARHCLSIFNWQALDTEISAKGMTFHDQAE
ncbi:hypothetical protein [Pseudobacteriovorax antillogorgiicola]|nr:hypothetical protein [Pseudobacteriovorax antillogorgiicola]